MSAQIGLFSNKDDEKGNESMYDEIQNKLHKTLYELNLTPSCRVFIQPKFKGHRRVNDGDSNIMMRIVHFFIDLIKMALEHGWNGVVLFSLCFGWLLMFHLNC
eukprot:TRINITY_DN3984_c0_g1_i1.p1 TRINITY_DN3984_c0_g1~~TRINITY_DN3984_c0_g1_i1.p1  ORF type:complete len:103 (-),score=7.08 TRINITY_DN3984_c0_g1_i1:83-391(-)